MLFRSTIPMFVLQNKLPLSIEFFHTQQYPEAKYLCMQVDTKQPILFKSCHMSVSSGTYGYIGNTSNATDGKLFLEDTHDDIFSDYPMYVWMRHWNPENNPANPNSTRVYASNKGGNWWILGIKTEGIATHLETSGGGKTEILGGFFRDHISSNNVPFFVTNDACISASFLSYDWSSCGNSRAYYFRNLKNGVIDDLKLSNCSHTIGLYTNCASITTSLEDKADVSIDFSSYPNPCKDLLKISYNIPISGSLKLELRDALSNPVKILVQNNNHAVGSYEVESNLGTLKDGFYLIILNINGKELIRKLIVQN